MATCSDDWKSLSQDPVSNETTTEQPKSCLKHAFRKSRLEAREKEDGSWCQTVLCGKRRSKRIISEMVESTRSLEVQNSECAKRTKTLSFGIIARQDDL
ncbi:hypothetical protein AVEN_114550-1 [Araneus ventricosus]|uniref:Uncharacterized protein n=1 Tax=Araneus ventricosus TaxID=182803 RepID=A0A4Y2JGT4_ARAVE|nr:hypothetical protein AVEN_114550-1 [Araneus ventricosus]